VLGVVFREGVFWKKAAKPLLEGEALSTLERAPSKKRV